VVVVVLEEAQTVITRTETVALVDLVWLPSGSRLPKSLFPLSQSATLMATL
jgi:hypothetical protein